MKQKITLIVFFLLVVVSGMLMSQVKVNYDLEKYLPKDSEIINSLDIYRDNFGEASYAFIALNEDEVGKALVIKTELSNIENVKTVIFVDDYLNELTYSIIKASIPLEYHDSLDSLLNGYLNSGLTFPEALFNLSVNFPDKTKG
jgi:predicted RND superfamily exporter protein